MKGEACPICEEYAKVRRSDEEYAKQLKAKKRVLVYLIDRDAEKEGLQVWSMPQNLDAEIVKISVDKRTGETFSPDDPRQGFDVSFERNGKGLKTKYEAVQLARRESDLGNDDWWQEATDNPLPELLNYFSYDHIAAAFDGKGAARDSREEQRDEPRRRDAPDRDAPRDEPTRRSREEPTRRDEPPPLDWASVHSMTSSELDALCAEMDELKALDPNQAKDDEELADWICEDLKIPKAASRRRTVEDDPPPEERLRSMRVQAPRRSGD